MSKQSHIIFDLDQLHDRCEEVNPIDAQATVKELVAKLKKYPDLYALSAPQIGIKERVICLKFNDGVIKEYINPVPLKAEKLHLVRERDISIADKEFITPRPGKLFVQYLTQDARPEENKFEGVVAEVFDRMVNYLDGITPVDFGLEVLPEFDEASKDEQQQVIDMYLNSLKQKAEQLEKDIKQDKEASELLDAIRFMAAVDSGRVQLVDKPVDQIK